MFIRKRERTTKRGKTSTTYQLLETYREAGKVKQRVICSLGRQATLKEALEYAAKKVRELQNSRIRDIEERGERLPECYKYSYWFKRLKQLESVVSKNTRRRNKLDTTKLTLK